MNVEERIVEKARELFIKYGINAVRTEDISRHLRISKKTFYHHFISKEELVTKVAQREINHILQLAEELKASTRNPILQAIELWDMSTSYLQSLNPNFLVDIQRFYPDVWTLFENLRQRFLTGFLVPNIKNGIAQKFYLPELNEQVTAWLWMELTQIKCPESYFDRKIMHHFIRGLLTGYGCEQYDVLKNNINLGKDES